MPRPQATYEFEGAHRTFEEISKLCPLIRTKPMLAHHLRMGRRTVASVTQTDPAATSRRNGRLNAKRYSGYTFSHRHLKAADDQRVTIVPSKWGAEAQRKYHRERIYNE